MDLTSVDEEGNVMPVPKGSSLIPWDDPYPYFKGVPVLDEFEEEEVVPEEPKEGGLNVAVLLRLLSTARLTLIDLTFLVACGGSPINPYCHMPPL